MLKAISPQAAKIYELLLKSGTLNAKGIAKKLNILPNAVYRATKELVGLEFAEEIHQCPIVYRIKPKNHTIEWLMNLLKLNFEQLSGASGFENTDLKISFIQNRKELLAKTNIDTKKAQTSFNLIVSGHEIPAETILNTKQAIDRGVKTRALVQQITRFNKDMLGNWQKIGIEVKYYPNIEARIFVYDHRIVYFTSYVQKNPQEAVGVRFEYTPFAKLMDELFEQRWQIGKDINIVKC